MNNLDEKNVTDDKSNRRNKNVWKTMVFLIIILVAVFAIVWYFYLSNSKLLSSKQGVSGKNMCAGVNIVFFPGGNAADSFASVVYNGAKAAETDLGATVTYVWSDWDSNKMVSQFMDAISQTPDAIAVMGHPGSAALGPLIDEAERKNIIVTSQNVDLTDIRTKYASAGFGYVGQSLYDSGLAVANALIRKYSLNEKNEAIVFGVDPILEPSRYQRTKGEVDGLNAGKLIVHEVAMSPEVEKDPSALPAQNMISEAINKYPNAKVIIADHGQLTASISTILKNLDKKPGEFMIAGFDLSPNTVAGIKNGYLGLVLDQQPYLQGYLPILQACLTKKYGFAGLYINTGVGLIDSTNVDLVARLTEQKIR